MVESIQQFKICIDGVVDLADADKLIGRVGARGFSRTELYAAERHQSLVRQSRGAEWRHAHAYTFLYQRMLHGNAGRVETERAGADLAAEMAADKVEHFLVGV